MSWVLKDKQKLTRKGSSLERFPPGGNTAQTLERHRHEMTQHSQTRASRYVGLLHRLSSWVYLLSTPGSWEPCSLYGSK